MKMGVKALISFTIVLLALSPLISARRGFWFRRRWFWGRTTAAPTNPPTVSTNAAECKYPYTTGEKPPYYSGSCSFVKGGQGVDLFLNKNPSLRPNLNSMLDGVKRDYKYIFLSESERKNKIDAIAACNGYRPWVSHKYMPRTELQIAANLSVVARKKRNDWGDDDGNLCCPAYSYFLATDKLTLEVSQYGNGKPATVYPVQFCDSYQLIPVKQCTGAKGDCRGQCVDDLQPVAILVWCYPPVTCAPGQVTTYYLIESYMGCLCKNM